MKIAIPRAWPLEEKRVAVVPDTAALFLKMGFSVGIQQGAGQGAFFPDADYEKHEGVSIYASEDALFRESQVFLFVTPPSCAQKKKIPSGSYVIGLLGRAAEYPEGVKAFNLERLPRISRAQSMDALSSQSNLYGYWAALQSALLLPRVMPMMTTASGGLKPAHIVVLGAGVAGLQAIATAKRLGAVVSAFDVRAAAKGEVESLGASFIEVNAAETGEGEGGYARLMDEAYKQAQRAKIQESLAKADGVICSALVPGRAPPVLIESDMVAGMKPGSVIIDLAADREGDGSEDKISGNCVLSCRGQIREVSGVRIFAPFHGLSALAQDASKLYARNLFEFIHYMWQEDHFRAVEGDPILEATLLGCTV